MDTLGIDISVVPERTVACQIQWSNGRALVEAPIRPVDDDRLAELLVRRAPCGIDVPLGWPIPFVDALVAHQAFQSWPARRATVELAFRATDRWIAQETRRTPLSVSTDRIGRTALRVAKVMSEISADWPRTYRAGTVGGVVEVYPAAALARWGTRRYRYKSRARGATDLAAATTEFLTRPWLEFENEDCRELYTKDEDNFDAFIASLVARAHANGHCEPIPSEFEQAAGVEGWIALPRRGTLDALA